MMFFHSTQNISSSSSSWLWIWMQFCCSFFLSRSLSLSRIFFFDLMQMNELGKVDEKTWYTHTHTQFIYSYANQDDDFLQWILEKKYLYFIIQESMMIILNFISFHYWWWNSNGNSEMEWSSKKKNKGIHHPPIDDQYIPMMMMVKFTEFHLCIEMNLTKIKKSSNLVVYYWWWSETWMNFFFVGRKIGLDFFFLKRRIGWKGIQSNNFDKWNIFE